jgi:uroporphyrinogen decarboxylase
MGEMTPRERVWLAIQHRQPDRVPFDFTFTEPAAQKLQAVYGTRDLVTALDCHIVRYKPRLPAELPDPRPGFFKDEFGVTWNRTVDTDIGIPDDYLLKRRSLEGFTMPDADNPRRYAGLPAFVANYPQRFRLVSYAYTLFERAWSLRGMPDLLVDMLEAPDWVDDLLDALNDFNLGVIRGVLRYDVDGIIFGDDWGQQRGLIFGPALWRRFVKPRLATLFAEVKRSGKAVMIHSCGRVQELFPELIDIGLDVFNPFQPDVMDVYDVKRRFGDRLAFYGGMSVQKMLPYGTPEQVRDETRRLMDGIGQGGGFIIAPSHHMPGDIPVENMLAFVEAVRA